MSDGDASQRTAYECCAECGRPFPFGRADGPRVEGALLFYGKHKVRLSPTERVIMRPLLRAFGSVVHTEVLYAPAFTKRDGYSPNILRVVLTQLRGKLFGTGLWIENEYGIGYRLVSDHNFDRNVER